MSSEEDLCTLGGNVSPSWSTPTQIGREDWACEVDSDASDACLSISSTHSSVANCTPHPRREYPEPPATTSRRLSPPPIPSKRSRGLTVRQSSPLALSMPQRPPSPPLPLPATQFTPSSTRPSPRPRNSAITKSSWSPSFPLPPPPSPPSPPMQQVLIVPAPSPPLPPPPSPRCLVFKLLRPPPGPPTPPAPPTHPLTAPSPPQSQLPAALPLLTVKAQTPPPSPPLSPPPPLYISEYLPVEEEADSFINYRREVCASDLPLRGGGDSPRNTQLLLPRIGDAGRTNVKWTQTTPVVNSGDRIVQTQSPPTGMLFS
ncbi:hypothetical protein SprV_0200615400 [Sparganum proliferum]